MADVVVLQEGEEPKDPRNFVLVEQIPAPRGAPRYTLLRWHPILSEGQRFRKTGTCLKQVLNG